MQRRLWVIGFVVWAAVGCAEATRMPARTSVSGALRAGGAPRVGQGFEVVAAGRDGDVCHLQG